MAAAAPVETDPTVEFGEYDDLIHTAWSFAQRSIGGSTMAAYAGIWGQWCDHCTRMGKSIWVTEDTTVGQVERLMAFAAVGAVHHERQQGQHDSDKAVSSVVLS